MIRIIRDFLAVIGVISIAINISGYLDSFLQISTILTEYIRSWQDSIELLWRNFSKIIGVPYWRPAAQPIAFVISFVVISISVAPSSISRIEAFYQSLMRLFRTLKQDLDMQSFKYDFSRSLQPFHGKSIDRLYFLLLLVIVVLAANSNTEADGVLIYLLYFFLNLLVYGVLTAFITIGICGFVGYLASERLQRDSIPEEIRALRASLSQYDSEFKEYNSELDFNRTSHGYSESNIDHFLHENRPSEFIVSEVIGSIMDRIFSASIIGGLIYCAAVFGPPVVEFINGK